ncbi:MAG TPA: hypothetical protein VLW47_06285 [Thermodesulfobacteriota bacterium]|nr:hypothetical protein [Thermodesulfobacteriota bacterium]
MTGAMDDPADFHGSCMNYVEYEVRFDDKHPVTGVSELFVPWNPPKEGMFLGTADTLIESVNKSCAARRTVGGNPVEN